MQEMQKVPIFDDMQRQTSSKEMSKLYRSSKGHVSLNNRSSVSATDMENISIEMEKLRSAKGLPGLNDWEDEDEDEEEEHISKDVSRGLQKLGLVLIVLFSYFAVVFLLGFDVSYMIVP